METVHTPCANCESLLAALHEKDNEIKKLKLTVENLRILLVDYDKYSDKKKHSLKNLLESDVDEFSINFYNVEPSNLDRRDRNNREFFSKSVQTQTIDNLISHDTEEEKNRAFDSKFENQSDYVYDENYQMYYSLSTGYYYDEKSGLMYEPQSQTYYKYNYEKKEYETVPNELSSNLESANSYNCDSMVHQVNNLNLNDDASKFDNPEEKATEEASNSHNTVESFETDDCKLVSCDASEKATVTSDFTKDWHPPEGSNMTVTDMVKEVASEQSNMSDYVYNESYQMYYSPSTGYYYDAKRKLLYDPSSGIYYSYDAETQKYEFYSQAEPNQPEEEKEEKSDATEDIAKTERLKSRKLYWRKKLDQPDQILDVLKVDNNNEENEFSSPEDGEIFSSDDESIVRSPIIGPNSNSMNSSDDVCPPSIRAIVECSESLKIGSLILITCSGGIIGRDKTSGIYLPDICVSKVHAEITYNSDLQKYSIEDLGSQNGTFVNEQRLSEPKEKSDPQTLNHGDKLSFGSCKLLLHMHKGHDTCDHCEPGQVLAEISSQKEKTILCMSKEDKEKARREELRRMKKKYGLQGADFERKPSSKASQKYEDKAEVRRQTVGSDNPYEKTEEASMDRCVPESNKGFQMLKKMGWIEGQALGPSMSGASEPIPVIPWPKKAGFGSTVDRCAVVSTKSEEYQKKKWVKARERFFQLSLGEASSS